MLNKPLSESESESEPDLCHQMASPGQNELNRHYVILPAYNYLADNLTPTADAITGC